MFIYDKVTKWNIKLILRKAECWYLSFCLTNHSINIRFQFISVFYFQKFLPVFKNFF